MLVNRIGRTWHFLLFVGIICGATVYHSLLVPAPGNIHLGGENLFIAQALVHGRGFSDPFSKPTGPTAWMPPVYPIILAGLLLVLRTVARVSLAVVVLKCIILCATGQLVLKWASESKRCIDPRLALYTLGLWIFAYEPWYFELTHDEWVCLLLFDASLWLALRGGATSIRRGAVWGVLGGLGALTAPALGLVWLVLTSLSVFSTKRLSRSILLAGVIAAMIIGLWTGRNYVTFHRFIPVKANLNFDVYRANYATPDGIYTARLLMDHPYWHVRQDPNAAYTRLGETAFLDQYRELLRDALARDPWRMLRNTGNRLLALTVQRRKFSEERMDWSYMAIHAMPFLGFCVSLADRRRRRNRLWQIVALAYATYVISYACMAFYIRYVLGILPVFALLWFWGMDDISVRLRWLRSRIWRAAYKSNSM